MVFFLKLSSAFFNGALKIDYVLIGTFLINSKKKGIVFIWIALYLYIHNPSSDVNHV